MEMPVTLPVIEFVKGTYSYRLGTEIATWMEKKGIYSYLTIKWLTLAKTGKSLTSRGSHHRNLSVVFNGKNLFHLGKGSRNMSFN